MRKEIIIRMYVSTEKGQAKAMKVAATAGGVESVTLAGGDKSLLLVIGDDVDSNKLTKKLKKKVGSAEIVELRTLDTFDTSSISHHAAIKGGAAVARLPYNGLQQYNQAARSPYNGSQQYYQHQYGAVPMSPYAYHHHPSPMMDAHGGYGYGGYGSSYARAVAQSHPGNYSPLVERHDYYPMEKSSSRGAAAGAGAGAGAGEGADTGVKTFRSVPRRDSHSHSGGGCCIQ